MADLNMVVLVKGVPDFREGKVQFKDDNTLNRGKTPTVLNPNDHMALEAAREMQVKHGGTVSIMTMGPPNYKSILGEAMGICGDHAYLISDIKFAAADTWATAHALYYAMRTMEAQTGEDIDLLFAGFKSADGETGQTGPQTALLLDAPIVTHTTKLGVDPEGRALHAERFVNDTIEHCIAPLPGFIVTDPNFTSSYRKATDRLKLLDHIEAQAKKAEAIDDNLTVWNAEQVGADENKIGITGSPTIVRAVDPIPAAPQERTAEVIHKLTDDQLDALAAKIAERLKAFRKQEVVA